MKLNRDFYNRDTLEAAKDVLGKILVHRTDEGVVKGKIVEAEAYIGPNDKAAHSYNNRSSKRTKIMYGNGGYMYVFLIYGMYTCMNIVTNIENKPEALLIRALEPVEGIELMRKRRGVSDIKKLCSGPGKLCIAMNITIENYGEDLCGDSIFLEDAPKLPDDKIVCSKRINIDYAQEARDYLWRFTVKDSPFISVKP